MKDASGAKHEKYSFVLVAANASTILFAAFRTSCSVGVVMFKDSPVAKSSGNLAVDVDSEMDYLYALFVYHR